MRAGVVGLQLESAVVVNDTRDRGAYDLDIVRDISADLVKHTLAYFNHVDNVELAHAFNSHLAGIVLLPAGSGVEGALVEDDKVPSVLHADVGVDCNHFGSEVHLLAVVVIQVVCFS